MALSILALMLAIAVHLIHAQSGPSPDPDSPNFADDSYLSALNLSTSNTSLTANPLPLDIKCSGSHFGWRPSISDCESAKDYIAPDSTRYPWGQRRTGLGDNVFPLPYRVMGGTSCDLLDRLTNRKRMQIARCASSNPSL